MSTSESQSKSPILIDSPESGETVIRTLRDHSAFCYWCLVPLRVNPAVQFTDEGPNDPIRTVDTFDEYTSRLEDVPPDRIDEQGRIVEYAREEQTICTRCGLIDPAPQDSRSKETTQQAFTHVLSVLQDNMVSVDPSPGRDVVNDAFEKGHTGQFISLLGRALSRSTKET